MKYYLIVGEASGDLHASNLMRALKEQDQEADFRFFGKYEVTAMICSYCGAEIDQKRVYCLVCGTRQEPEREVPQPEPVPETADTETKDSVALRVRVNESFNFVEMSENSDRKEETNE